MINGITKDAINLYQKGAFLFPGEHLESAQSTYDIYKVASIGFAIDPFGEEFKKVELWRKASDEILKSGRISDDTMGEISTIALSSRLINVSKLTRVKESSRKTPDFEIVTSDGITCEIESTRPLPKEIQAARFSEFRELADKIKDIKKAGTDVVIFIGNKYSKNDADRICEFCKYNQYAGSSMEEADSFLVKITEPLNEIGVLIGEKRDERPHWFYPGENSINQFVASFKHIEGGANQGQVRIGFMTELKGYLNPLIRKTEEFQGTGDRPFILFFDVSNLPRGIQICADRAERIISRSDKISAVCIYDNLIDTYNVGYNFNIINNPNARHSAGFMEKDPVKFKNQFKLSVNIFSDTQLYK